jgi:hypothetical protein
MISHPTLPPTTGTSCPTPLRLVAGYLTDEEGRVYVRALSDHSYPAEEEFVKKVLEDPKYSPTAGEVVLCWVTKSDSSSLCSLNPEVSTHNNVQMTQHVRTAHTHVKQSSVDRRIVGYDNRIVRILGNGASEAKGRTSSSYAVLYFLS